ncbi:MAG: ThiF family adenylyltransferase [Clostridia bacterium]|nr:ThiF family adenylyltransferase [Clostridia bacterium]
MDLRYSRNIPAISPEEQDTLKGKKVLVLGCGGLGGYIIENLLRMGVGAITAVDGDSFDESNLNRQLLATEKTLGTNKAIAAAQRANAVNSQVSFIAIDSFFTAENAKEIVSGHDLVIDALDSIEARLLLEDVCAKLEVTIVHGAVNGWVMQAAVIPPGERLMHILYASPAEHREQSTLPMTAQLCAAMQCSEAVKLLCGHSSALENRLLTGDLQQLEWEYFYF